ncbi:hypothetical protein [Bacteroides sp.]|uniref:hypothetical protein n=1 Tax=Bacteroides sp. TaxID=29523 RepID=UPI0026058E87|nr:hypothetical protein [Bacteroides sp.]MDD3040147.1 hypothetical protein [Bacteroides sp.]
MITPERYNEILADEINRIYSATKVITFSKNMAAEIVGGRRRLEDLVGHGKIEVDKPTAHQHGKWRCKADDVLRYAYSEEYPI